MFVLYIGLAIGAIVGFLVASLFGKEVLTAYENPTKSKEIG